MVGRRAKQEIRRGRKAHRSLRYGLKLKKERWREAHKFVDR